ncbi:hypothetical protein ElyMa_004938600 [Elysia marginata]|uniref:Uncharacterized protein n=1 Tax=Elysia marginata TaxID=1093978 RepID=A0AAV4IYY0_9GAST|nr:hypothetical protein ElyMa_004938600 [Elysia marginata]
MKSNALEKPFDSAQRLDNPENFGVCGRTNKECATAAAAIGTATTTTTKDFDSIERNNLWKLLVHSGNLEKFVKIVEPKR